MTLPEYAIVWVCKDCGQYYAASGAGDLRNKFNTDLKGEPTFARARCPTMECAKKGTMRIPIRVRLVDGSVYSSA